MRTEEREAVERLMELAARAQNDAEVRRITTEAARLARSYRMKYGVGMPPGPLEQACEIDSGFAVRPHLSYLSQRVAQAVEDVENGHNRQLAISMPPRAGKSTLLSVNTPVWLLRRHPEWKIITSSHDGGLTGAWAKEVRRKIEENPSLGIALRRGGGSSFTTTEGGGLLARTARSGITGRGAKVFVIDDPVRDFVEANSATIRKNLWDWWLSVVQTRLEPPYLVMIIMTRWHPDDIVGRLFSDEHEGDPADWERISVPAIAEADDALGRSPGEPLISPIIEEDADQARARWENVQRAVGSHTFAGMYQQRPAPAEGAVFDSAWWRYWTTDPNRATEDGRVVYLDPSGLTGGSWCDSWDSAFKADTPGGGSYVVGQRWVRDRANRYLIAQQRGRWTFTKTIEKMKRWARADDPAASPCGHLVHTRLIEEAANGAAIIDVLKNDVAGLKPIKAVIGKTARAQAVTPECESGNVYLPHPSDPGNDWVRELLSELRDFPDSINDDQVDALSQALNFLHSAGGGGITVPGRGGPPRTRTAADLTSAALSDLRRQRGRGR